MQCCAGKAYFSMFSCNDVTVFVVLLYPDHILMLCNVAGLAHTTYLLNTQRQVSFLWPSSMLYCLDTFIYKDYYNVDIFTIVNWQLLIVLITVMEH